MTDPAGRRATYADVASAPEHTVAELVDGELITSPRPAIAHANVTSVLGMELGSPFHRGRGGPGGWWILDEPELRLGADVLVPDLAGWRRERLPELPQEPAFTLAPDWVCEVLSPSTARVDRVLKLPVYARAGVAHVWLVDPSLRTLDVFGLREGAWTLLSSHTDDDRVRAVPFEAVELDLSGLWGGPV